MFPHGILSPPENVVAEAAKTVSTLGEKELKALILKNTTLTTNVLSESGTAIDWSKVTSLTGKTDEEKCEKMQYIQAETEAALKRRSDLQNKSILTDRNEARIEAIENAANTNVLNQQVADKLVKSLKDQIAGTVNGGNRNLGLELANSIHEDFTAPALFDGGNAIKNHWYAKGNIHLEGVGLNDMIRTALNAMSTTVDATDGGFRVISPVSDTVVDQVRRPNIVANLFPRVEVPYPQYIYMRETLAPTDVTGNNLPFGVETKEGLTTATQLHYRWDQEIVDVRELIVYSKVTGQQLSYVPTLQGRINNNMIYDALNRLDNQLINGASRVAAGAIGSPAAENKTGADATRTTQLRGLDGFLTANETIAMPTTAANANTLTGGAYKADDHLYFSDLVAFMIKDIMENGDATMDFLLMNPTNWAQISILRDTNGVRLIGDEQTRATPSLIGIPVLQTRSVAAGNAFGGARNWAELPFMNGVDLGMTDTHSDDYLKNLITIRLMLRAALAVLRPQAFKKVTGVAARRQLT